MKTLDGIELELMWSHLRSIVTEHAKAMQRSAFSPVVREAGDLAYGLFDERGRMIAQADTGTPGHINCLAAAGTYLTGLFGKDLRPGDIVVNNDPWRGAGHVFDITVYAPIFRGEKIIGYVGSTNHHTDIGGLGSGTGAHDVHEEGLWIPPLKLYEEGKPNQTLFGMIRANVRVPDVVCGDLAAQVASALSGGQAVVEMCARYGLPDLSSLGDAIIERSERAMREAIRRCPSGTWTGAAQLDIPNGDIVKLVANVTVDSEAGEVLIDFTGSSPESKKAVNAVLNYTHAYSTCAVKSILNPEIPNNAGSLAPIKVSAPEGSIVNCRYPAPVAARHIIGMYVPMPIMKAFYQVVPERVVAPGTGSSFSVKVNGTFPNNQRFVSSISGLTGGMGARAHKPGLSATYYPAGLGSIPIEVIEAESLIVFHRREIRHGSGGRGAFNGGDGQVVEFSVATDRSWTLDASPTSRRSPPEGLGGGESGRPATFRVNGEERIVQGKSVMNPGDVIYLETAGGGGYGKPKEAIVSAPSLSSQTASPVKASVDA